MLLRLFLLPLLACTASDPADSAAPDSGASPEPWTVVTFNTGTTQGTATDDDGDGYGSEQAALSDQYYGDGLAWVQAVESTRDFLAQVQPDLIAFQEIFWSGECPEIPEDAWPGFVCESWQDGDPTVAQVILGEGYQVACNPGHPDKCLGVRRDFGSFAGCEEDFCLEGLAGFTVDGCGSGARVGRAEVLLADGGALTVVGVHGTSGVTDEDTACRLAQVEQIFTDLGDGQPGANGDRNIVLGDLNTDPYRFAGFDQSAQRWNDYVGEGLAFDWITQVGPDAPGSYAGVADIDHVASDRFVGDCWHGGMDGQPDPYPYTFFDHHPVVCTVTAG